MSFYNNDYEQLQSKLEINNPTQKCRSLLFSGTITQLLFITADLVLIDIDWY